jgi:hypothetical protein
MLRHSAGYKLAGDGHDTRRVISSASSMKLWEVSQFDSVGEGRHWIEFSGTTRIVFVARCLQMKYLAKEEKNRSETRPY